MRKSPGRWLALMCLVLAAPAAGQEASVQALIERAEAIANDDAAGALDLLARALPTLPPGTQRREALALRCLVTASTDARASLLLAAEALPEAVAADDATNESRLLRCEGSARETLGEMGVAAQRYASAVSAAEMSGDGEVLAEALASRGQMRHFSGEYDGAIEDLTRAHGLSVELGLARFQSGLLNAMANIYADAHVGEFDKAIGYYRLILAANERDGDQAGIATAHFNLGSTLERKGDLAPALAHYRRALDLDRARGDKDSVADELRVIGAVLSKQGKHAEALDSVNRALAQFEANDDLDGRMRGRLTRGIALRAAARPADALQDLDAAAAHFRAESNPRYLLRIEEERAAAFADLQQWREAHAALGEQFRLQRELDRKLAEDRTARLRVQFDAERTEQRNLALQAENEQRGAALEAAARERRLQRLVIVLGALLLAVVAGLALRQLAKARRMRVLALTDELTGVANRRSILAHLEQQRRSARPDQPLCVASFDLDHFKRVNDVHGHDGGDRALRALTQRIAATLRSGDRLGRIGGEEFLIVLPATSLPTALEIVERARAAVDAAPFDEIAPGVRLSISAGVGEWQGSADTGESLLQRIDAALYRAKEAGRNCVVPA